MTTIRFSVRAESYIAIGSAGNIAYVCHRTDDAAILGYRGVVPALAKALNLQGQLIPAAFLFCLFVNPAWAVGNVEDIVVGLRWDGPAIIVEVDCFVQAPAPIAWDVLTDYAHMAQYLTNLESSVVEERKDNWMRVHQVGKASQGPFSLRFDNVREVELVPPDEVRSRFMNGDFKDSTFVTRMVASGTGIRIVNSGRYVTNLWIPPVIGPTLVAAGIRKQFGEIRDEILRRTALAAPPP
jgi:Polyketide cyclase / dehydrase and lipid transport